MPGNTSVADWLKRWTSISMDAGGPGMKAPGSQRLDIKAVALAYGRTTIVYQVTPDAEPGELVALLAASRVGILPSDLPYEREALATAVESYFRSLRSRSLS